ncbi:MAG: DUF6114 domain-containing protein [Gordonia sp. (in: high G+C Gram-positive bacteria)]|uniref:DUF6114 domain-containing protein n=1 Tax=Gordonia sp. (in: high G+C Gram-positive bacteria) TaxID=84139 RepID=UPI0039E3189B
MTTRRQRFREWRRRRPFAGGVFLLLSAVFLALPAINDFKIGDLVLTVSTISGISTVVLSILMVLCGIAAIRWLHTRVVVGVTAMVVAIVAFPASNFGGFIIGTVFGIIGAALVLAWRPYPEDRDDDRDDEEVPDDGGPAVRPHVDDDGPAVRPSAQRAVE